jgi:hypothetical protein
MAKQTDHRPPAGRESTQREQRQQREAAALRRNLLKRKVQARSREDGPKERKTETDI